MILDWIQGKHTNAMGSLYNNRLGGDARLFVGVVPYCLINEWMDGWMDGFIRAMLALGFSV